MRAVNAKYTDEDGNMDLSAMGKLAMKHRAKAFDNQKKFRAPAPKNSALKLQLICARNANKSDDESKKPAQK